MSEPDKQTRIFVDLDVGSDSERTVRAAATLAAALSAELHGMFVVDEAWHDLARLPFSAAIDPDHGTTADVSPDTMRTAISRRERSSRRMLSSHAERMQVHWTFRSERGRIIEQLQSIAAPSDYVVISGPAPIEGVAGMLRKLADLPKSTRGVVLSSEKHEPADDSPVIVLLTDSASSKPAIALGVKVSAVLQAPIQFFVISEDPETIRDISARLNRQLEIGRFVIKNFTTGALHMVYSKLQEQNPRFVIASPNVSVITPNEEIVQLIKAAGAPFCLLQMHS